MHKSLVTIFLLAVTFVLGGCYYTSPAPLIADSGSSCAGLRGMWGAFDPQAMVRERQTGQRATIQGFFAVAQMDGRCEVYVRRQKDVNNGLPASHLLGADRDLKAFLAAQSLTNDGRGNSVLVLQIKTSDAPGVNFGASAPILYVYAVRSDTPDGSMLTIMKPTCAQSSCSALTMSELSAAITRDSRQPSPSNVLAILIKGR